MQQDLGLKILVLSPLIGIGTIVFIASAYLGHKYSRSKIQILKAIVGILVLTILAGFNSNKIFGQYNFYYALVIFILVTGGYFIGLFLSKK